MSERQKFSTCAQSENAFVNILVLLSVHKKQKLTVSVESIADLRRNVGQVECFIHGFLIKLDIGCGYHVATIVIALEIIGQLCTELNRDIGIFLKVGFAAVDSFSALERLGCQMFGDPVGVSVSSVVGCYVGASIHKVVDRS